MPKEAASTVYNNLLQSFSNLKKFSFKDFYANISITRNKSKFWVRQILTFSKHGWLPELSDDSFYLSSVGRNVPEPPPVVSLYGEISEGQQTEDRPSSVADDHVEDPVIPPALGEVWKLVLEGVFQELEHDGDHGGEPPVSENEGFTPVPFQ